MADLTMGYEPYDGSDDPAIKSLHEINARYSVGRSFFQGYHPYLANNQLLLSHGCTHILDLHVQPFTKSGCLSTDDSAWTSYVDLFSKIEVESEAARQTRRRLEAASYADQMEAVAIADSCLTALEMASASSTAARQSNNQNTIHSANVAFDRAKSQYTRAAEAARAKSVAIHQASLMPLPQNPFLRTHTRTPAASAKGERETRRNITKPLTDRVAELFRQGIKDFYGRSTNVSQSIGLKYFAMPSMNVLMYNHVFDEWISAFFDWYGVGQVSIETLMSELRSVE